MENETINQLQTAFSQAPSMALAQVLLDQLKSQPEKLNAWLQADAQLLNATDRLTLAELMQQSEPNSMALALLDNAISEHGPLWIRLKCIAGEEDAVKSWLDQLDATSHDRSTLTELFEQIQAELKPSDARRKLKVVEKIDMAEITDLQRYLEETTDFSDVVGLDNIKKQINKKIILPFQKPSLFQRFKKKIGGGVLLYGPPGCGKTLLARATAGECHASFYNIEISDILDMYIGESEQKLHAIFEKARSETPSVLFFDEFEALAGKRESQRNSTSNNLVSQFLTELDGFTQNNSGVLVLASTNVPWSIDPAFMRPGRFDRMFFVPPPDRVARQGILEHHMQERPAESDIDYANLAAKAKAYSGADLYNLVEMAADEAIDDSIEQDREVLINQTHFKLALQESNSTTLEWLTTARNYARYANDGGRYNEVMKFLKKHGK